MELGLTFPLQRLLRVPPPDYGAQTDSRFCWDLHVITLRGRESLLAVHCPSRYAFVRYDMGRWDWERLADTFLTGLGESLSDAGFSQKEVEDYLRRAGAPRFTRTHGRREVAFLNRAWEDVLALDYCLDESASAQPLLNQAVNRRPSRCAGFDGLGTGAERLRLSLK